MLRVFPPHLRQDRDREVEILRAIESIPVPRVEAVGDPFGLPTVLISWCPGITLYEAFLASPENAVQLGMELGRLQAQLHLSPITERIGSLLSRDWIDWFGGGEGPLGDKLRDCVPEQESIIHLDFHPLNVMIDRGTVTGVIDWECAYIGDPRADVARTYSILAWVPLPSLSDTPAGRRLRAAFRRAWLSGYQEVAGPLQDMAPFLAWAARATLHNLTPKIGRPGVWYAERDLDTLRVRARRWMQRAGINPDA